MPTMVPRMLGAPGKYLQGREVLLDLGTHLQPLGNSAVLIADATVRRLVGEIIEGALRDAKVESTWIEFGGECSFEEIDRVVDVAETVESGVIVGIGGGKTIDTAKVAGTRINHPIAVVPTIAATDAPTSVVSVVYSPDGVFEKILHHPHNPDLVAVDVEVIARAPSRFLVAGMGDALATWFEADAVWQSHAVNELGGLPTAAGHALARLCFETLLEYGVPALRAAEADAVTPALERIVEANILLSGLGFESGGLAAAHAIHNGLTVLEGVHRFLHGEKVAVGTIAQLFLEDRSQDTIEQVMDFCLEVGLPLGLSYLGLAEVGDRDLARVAKAACAPGESIHHEPFPVTPAMVVDALKAADAYGQSYR